jgi:hypothetical protein
MKAWISIDGNNIEAYASAVRVNGQQITLDFRTAPGEINAIAAGRKYEIGKHEAFGLLTAKSASKSAQAKLAGSSYWEIADPFEAAAYYLKDENANSEGIGVEIVDQILGDDEIVLQPSGKMQLSQNLVNKEIKIQCLVKHQRWLTLLDEPLERFNVHTIDLSEDKTRFIYQAFEVEPIPHKDLTKTSLRRIRASVLSSESTDLIAVQESNQIEQSKINSWRLDFLNFDFKLIFSSDIPLTKHKAIRAYHLELRKAIEGLTVYPFGDSDLNLYADFGFYYQKVMDLIVPGINCDDLEGESRHRFFVCSEITADSKGQPRLGLSGLERLMGYSYLEQEEESEPTEPPITTGDTVLDVTADINLIFKSNAKWMINTYGLDELALIARQANARMQDPAERTTEIAAVEDPIFNRQKKQLLSRLAELSITTPSGF